jgi:hypothetical protein
VARSEQGRSSSLAPPRLTRSVIERAPANVPRPDSDSVTSISASAPSHFEMETEELPDALLESEEVVLEPPRPRAQRPSGSVVNEVATKLSPAMRSSSPSRPTLIPARPLTAPRRSMPTLLPPPVEPLVHTEPHGLELAPATASFLAPATVRGLGARPPAARASRADVRRSMPAVSVNWQPDLAAPRPSFHDVSMMMQSRVGRAAKAKQPFKLELSVVIAVITGVLAFGVMVAAILFVSSEDRPSTTAQNALSSSLPTTGAEQPSPSASTLAPPTAMGPTAAPPALTPPPIAAAPVAPVRAKKARTSKNALTADAPKPVRAAAVASEPDRAKAPKKAGKSVEEILDELGQEQLRR